MGRWDRGRCLNTSRTLSTGYKGPGGSRVGCREEESVVGDGDGGDQGRTNYELSVVLLCAWYVRSSPPPCCLTPPPSSRRRGCLPSLCVSGAGTGALEDGDRGGEAERPREDKKQEGGGEDKKEGGRER